MIIDKCNINNSKFIFRDVVKFKIDVILFEMITQITKLIKNSEVPTITSNKSNNFIYNI